MTAEEKDGGEHTDDGREGQRAAQSARSLARPDLTETADLVAGGLEDGAVVTVSGRCTVSYRGRASSEAPAGTRHVVLKPDGTVLVHDPDGHRPVNWQPPGSDVECRVADDGPVDDDLDGDVLDHAGGSGGPAGDPGGGDATREFVVESRRRSPDERLVVRFSSVLHAAAVPVESTPPSEVVGTEADLKERVLDGPDLVESGFRPLATERETPAGAVDVYGTDEEGRTVVLELKRRRAGPDAVGQLDRYVTALRRDLHAGAEVRGVLVAPSVTERASALLEEEGLEFVALRPRPG